PILQNYSYRLLACSRVYVRNDNVRVSLRQVQSNASSDSGSCSRHQGYFSRKHRSYHMTTFSSSSLNEFRRPVLQAICSASSERFETMMSGGRSGISKDVSRFRFTQAVQNPNDFAPAMSNTLLETNRMRFLSEMPRSVRASAYTRRSGLYVDA